MSCDDVPVAAGESGTGGVEVSAAGDDDGPIGVPPATGPVMPEESPIGAPRRGALNISGPAGPAGKPELSVTGGFAGPVV